MPLPSPRRNPSPVNRTACTLLAALLAVASSTSAQISPQGALDRPIAEAGLVEKIDTLTTAEAATTAAVLTAPRATPVNPRDAVPEPAAEPAKKAKGATEITAMEATFDNKKHEAIFTRNVTVNDPEFSVTCDRLVAMLKHEGSTSGNAKPTEKSPAAAPKPGTKSKGGLDRAIAEGNVVIRQSKVEADGSTSQSFGKAQKADYNAVTGDIVLSGMPIVQQGLNQCISTAPETVMTLNRDRNMKVVGPHRTIISDKADLEK